MTGTSSGVRSSNAFPRFYDVLDHSIICHACFSLSTQFMCCVYACLLMMTVVFTSIVYSLCEVQVCFRLQRLHNYVSPHNVLHSASSMYSNGYVHKLTYDSILSCVGQIAIPSIYSVHSTTHVICAMPGSCD